MTAPLDRRLKAVKWGDFKLGDLFEIRTYKKRFDANKVTILASGGHPYIVRMGGDNGQKGYIDENEQFLNDGNTISFGQDTATIFYQEKPYFTGDKIKILAPKLKRFKKMNAQFFLAAMRKTFQNFSWGTSRFNVGTLAKQLISLPVTSSGSIDFDFMEEIMCELEEERMSELDRYLVANKLDNNELTGKECSVLQEFEKRTWQEFRLGDLCQIEKTSSFNTDRLVPGDDYDYITRTSFNQGILQPTGFVNERNINQAGTWSLGLLQMDFFYRKKPWYAGQFVRKIVARSDMPELARLFLTTILNGQKTVLLSVLVRDVDATFRNAKVMLPARADGSPDWAAMELFMRAVQKLVVRDVVAWKDREIAATRRVVAREGGHSRSPRRTEMEPLPEVPSKLRFLEYLPLYSLKAACGRFGDGEAVEPLGWVKADIGRKLDDKMFVVQAVGRSMEPKIRNGDLCVMRAWDATTGGTPDKPVLVQHRDAADPETGGAYSIKNYSSEKAPRGERRHERIILSPLNPDFPPMVFGPDTPEDTLKAVAVFVGVLPPGGQAPA